MPDAVIDQKEQRTRDMVLERIPAFSPVILKVLDLLARDDGDLVKLSRVITADAALSSQLLRLANSALFGFSYRIDTVQKAALAVGDAWIQQLAISVGAGSYMKSACQSEELHRSWAHTLATAVLCRELARAAGMAGERAYTAGLLHDIGCLGLMAAFPEEYREALYTSRGDARALLAEEKRRFGANHCEIGSWLMEDWRLPSEFCLVIGQHHDEPAGGEFDLVTVAQLASSLADSLGYGLAKPACPMTLEAVRERLPEFARTQFPSDPIDLVQAIEEAIAGKISMPVTAEPAPAPVTVAIPPKRPWYSRLSFLMAGIAALLGFAVSVRVWFWR